MKSCWEELQMNSCREELNIWEELKMKSQHRGGSVCKVVAEKVTTVCVFVSNLQGRQVLTL